MRKNKIILTADTEIVDNEVREWVVKLFTKIETINKRTKRHTRDIQELRRKLKNEKS
jgi:hypothetical protein